MEVRADKAKVWRKDFKTRDGKEFYRYSVSISKKDNEGKYVNAYIPVMFSKKCDPPDKIENGAMVYDLAGFMSINTYTDKEGKLRTEPMIVVMKANFDDAEELAGYAEVEEDIEF